MRSLPLTEGCRRVGVNSSHTHCHQTLWSAVHTQTAKLQTLLLRNLLLVSLFRFGFTSLSGVTSSRRYFLPMLCRLSSSAFSSMDVIFGTSPPVWFKFSTGGSYCHESKGRKHPGRISPFEGQRLYEPFSTLLHECRFGPQ